MSRPFILLDISAFLLYCFLVSPLVYQFICWVLTFLCIYLFIYLMFVLYLQKSFCKPFQISQIEYSDGASIILNLSGSKKEYVFVFFHLSMYLCCPLLAFVYLSIFWSTYFLYSFIFGIFFDLVHPCLYLLFTDHLLFIYLQYLLYVSSIHSSRYFGLSFVLFLGFSIGLSIYLLGVDFPMYLLVHLFDVGVLPTKFFLQTPPDFTDRIFRWSFHLLTFLFITLTLYYFSLYSCFFWYILLMYSIHSCTF